MSNDIKIVNTNHLRNQISKTDSGWRNSQAGAMLGAHGNQVGQENPSVSLNDIDAIANGYSEVKETTPSAYQTLNCPSMPSKEAEMARMIKDYIKQNGSIVVDDSTKPSPKSGPKMILG